MSQQSFNEVSQSMFVEPVHAPQTFQHSYSYYNSRGTQQAPCLEREALLAVISSKVESIARAKSVMEDKNAQVQDLRKLLSLLNNENESEIGKLNEDIKRMEKEAEKYRNALKSAHSSNLSQCAAYWSCFVG